MRIRVIAEAVFLGENLDEHDSEEDKLLSFKRTQQGHLFLSRFASVWVLTQGQVEVRASFENRLRVCELAEAPFAVVSAHAGMARAVEGHAFHHHVDADLVDAPAAELLRAEEYKQVIFFIKLNGF